MFPNEAERVRDVELRKGGSDMTRSHSLLSEFVSGVVDHRDQSEASFHSGRVSSALAGDRRVLDAA